MGGKVGYQSSTHGAITIHPPLSHAEMKAHPEIAYEATDIWVMLSVSEVETDEGVLLRKTGVAICTYEDDFKAYHLEDHFKEIVEAFPGHEWRGHIDVYGEDSTDIWRMQVTEGKPEIVHAEIRWPDGSKVESNY